jgi:hypothetical protein
MRMPAIFERQYLAIVGQAVRFGKSQHGHIDSDLAVTGKPAKAWDFRCELQEKLQSRRPAIFRRENSQ